MNFVIMGIDRIGKNTFIFEFICLGKGSDCLAGKVKKRLDAQHEIEIRGGM